VADLITPEQVGARMRRTFADSWLTQVQAHCEDVSGLVRDIADGHLDEATHETVPVAVRRVAYEMVRRAVENPHGFTTEGTDTVFRWQVAEGQDTLYATEEEAEIIRGAVGLGALSGIDMTIDLPERLLYPYRNQIHTMFGDS